MKTSIIQVKTKMTNLTNMRLIIKMRKLEEVINRAFIATIALQLRTSPKLYLKSPFLRRIRSRVIHIAGTTKVCRIPLRNQSNCLPNKAQRNTFKTTQSIYL